MSRINDALKSAEQARPNGDAPAAAPALMPATGSSASGIRGNWLLIALIVVAMAASAFMAWKWFRSQ